MTAFVSMHLLSKLKSPAFPNHFQHPLPNIRERGENTFSTGITHGTQRCKHWKDAKVDVTLMPLSYNYCNSTFTPASTLTAFKVQILI